MLDGGELARKALIIHLSFKASDRWKRASNSALLVKR